MDIQVWLRELGLSQYADAFYQNDIDETVLASLNEADLRELGLVSLGHRKKLLTALKKYRLTHLSDEMPAGFDGENRQVTVLFADIAGFVALSGKLGAESTHDLLNQYFKVVDDIIERYGGRVDKHIGDNVMGEFGVLLAHKDDPERAVRAAIEIRDAVTQLGEAVDCPLHIHIGVAHGQVVASHMGSHVHDEYTVIGPAANLAARLEGLSGLDEILVSDSVKQAVGDLVLADRLDQVKIKGIDHPLTVWRIQRLAPVQPEPLRSQFVGRRQELTALTDVLNHCMQTGAGRIVYIRGEAGIGKTRLLTEFRRIASQQGAVCHGVAILDFGLGSHGGLFRQLAEQWLGLTMQADPSERERRLQHSLCQHALPESTRMHLNALLEMPQSKAEQALYQAMDNQTRVAGKVEAVSRLVSANSQEQPVVIITIDDLHWIDDATLTQLASLIGRLAAYPVLVVLTSRIEGDPIDSLWWKRLPQERMQCWDMAPLSRQEALELVQSYADLDPAFAVNCVQRAEGNPLFLEQLIRTGQVALSPPLPSSLQSVVLGRVDQLDFVDKIALQTASVLGQHFTLETLRYLLVEPAYTGEKLVEHSLIYPDGDGYRFSHALIRDGVYQALLTSDRKQLHRRAAAWFSDQDLDLWATHLDRAEAAQAPSAYCQAAAAHYQRFQFELALGLARRGLELALAPVDRYDLTCLLAQLVQAIGSPTESIALYREAAPLATTDLQACRAWIGVAAGVRLSGGYEEGVIAINRALSLAKGEGADRALSQIHYFKGNFCFSKGDLDGCLQSQQKALDYAVQVQDPELEARALGGLADAVYANKRIKSAMTYYQRCVEVAQQHGFVQIEMANRHQMSAMMRYMHDLMGAIANNQLTLKMARQIGDRRTLMYTLDNQGELFTELGEYDLGGQSIEAALELSFSLNNKRYRAYILQRLARVRFCQGRRSDAKALLEDALKICHETEVRFVAPRVLGLLALVSEEAEACWDYLRQGDAILAQGCISHNFFWFYRDAIEAALTHQDWSRANHYADLLEEYTRVDPFPWSEFLVGRGRCLAAMGNGGANGAVIKHLEQLQSEAEQVKLGMSLPALTKALIELNAN
ncbi:MAG: adenylate/guanylate cyclase domain-containing protein [Leptolyngbyaceae cyanobacterium MO_188.B28]|nr:adenylate/guanylate cyclase domain-containing protein [Leptolyngbyaceae cyanobacterium MO_188.B28]